MRTIPGRAYCLAALAFSGAFSGALCAAPPDEKPRLTARQLFFTEAKPAAQAKPSRTAASKPAASKPAAAQAPAEVSSAKPAKPKSSPSAEPPAPVYASTPAGEATIVNAALGEGRIPLALRYSVVKVMPDGEEFEVNPTLVFRSGDRVRLRLEANQKGYLYIVARGSSGIWKPLFPAPELGDNLIDSRKSYVLPSRGHTWTMDSQPGEELIFVVFSRQPTADFDAMIDGLRDRRPAGTPQTPPRITLAKNLDDKFVEQYRTVYARDLVIEKMEAPGPAPLLASEPPSESRRTENAVYVASESGAADAQLVANIKLIHR
jgi:hypothetical protein